MKRVGRCEGGEGSVVEVRCVCRSELVTVLVSEAFAFCSLACVLRLLLGEV